MALHQHGSGWPSTPGILFAEDFDDDDAAVTAGPTEAELPPEPVFSQADLDAARLQAHAEGHRAALADLDARQCLAATEALGKLGRLVEEVGAQAEAQTQRSVEAICRLLFEMLAATLPGLCARHDATEIAGIVRELIVGMTPDAAVCVSVAPELADRVRAALAGLPADLGRRVVIEPKSGMAPGDARMSWEQGSATRSARATQLAINAVLTRFDLLDPLSMPTTPSVRIPTALEQKATVDA